MTIFRGCLFSLVLVAFFAPNALAKGSGRAEIHVNVTDNFGERQFCAGEIVHALPVNSKTTSIIEQIYGSTDKGFASIYATPELIIRREGTTYVGGTAPDATRIFRRKFKGQKRGKCNEADVAVFEGLEPGSYYLIIPVFWKRLDLPNRTREISLRGGGQNEIFIKVPLNYRGGTFVVQTQIAANGTTEFNLENQMVDIAPD